MAYQVHSYERDSTCSEWYSSSAHVVGIQGEMMSLLAVFFFKSVYFLQTIETVDIANNSRGAPIHWDKTLSPMYSMR